MIAQAHGISVKQQDEPMRLMSDSERDKCIQFATWIERQPLEIIRCQREGVSSASGRCALQPLMSADRSEISAGRVRRTAERWLQNEFTRISSALIKFHQSYKSLIGLGCRQ